MRGTAAVRAVTLQQLIKEEGDALFNYLEEIKRERKTELFVSGATTG